MAGGEDSLKECVKQVMDMTRRSEDEVVMALHDNDGDLDRAVNDLLEDRVKAEWEVKKKKLRQPSGSKQSTDQTGGQDDSGDWERRNQRSGGPPRMRGRANHDNRGCWFNFLLNFSLLSHFFSYFISFLISLFFISLISFFVTLKINL